MGQSVDDYAEHYHTFHKVSAFVNYNLVSRHHKVQGVFLTKKNSLYLLGYLFPVCNVNPHASQMDEYKHACTDCSFKCTNKHDLKVTTFASKEL